MTKAPHGQRFTKLIHTLFSLRARILSSKSWRTLSCSQKTLSFTCEQRQAEGAWGHEKRSTALDSYPKASSQTIKPCLKQPTPEPGGGRRAGEGQPVTLLHSVNVTLGDLHGFRLDSLRRSRPVICEVNNLEDLTTGSESELRRESSPYNRQV